MAISFILYLILIVVDGLQSLLESDFQSILRPKYHSNLSACDSSLNEHQKIKLKKIPPVWHPLLCELLLQQSDVKLKKPPPFPQATQTFVLCV